MIRVRIYVDGPKGKRELTTGPIPMNMFNILGLLVLTPMPEPIMESRFLGITFEPGTKGPQYLVSEGETLSIEVLEDKEPSFHGNGV